MATTILPFSLKQSNEKLTDRGSLLFLEEFMRSIGFLDHIDAAFPAPGSGRGIPAMDYVRTLIYHCADGGRHLEEIRGLKTDEGFRALLPLNHMPGPDAVGDWLRRLGNRVGTAPVQQVNDALVHRYAEASDCAALVLDIDATLIASDKGDATYNYKKFKSYHPMLGFLSDGTAAPLCSFVQFRQGNASAHTDILEALQHTVAVLPESGNLRYVRSDSAGYQHTLLEYCQEQGLWYTITAVQDASVHQAIRDIPATDWRRLHDQDYGFKTSREVAETVHTMAASRHSFRLVVVRELADTPDLFGPYTYWVIATNIPADGPHAKTSEEIVWHHQGRGNCERYIEDTKYGVMLRSVPCGQFDANAMYYAIGILAYNLLKLMQMLVLPASWAHRTVRSLRRGLFRFAGKVISRSRQWTLKIAQPMKVLRQVQRIREKIGALAAPG